MLQDYLVIIHASPWRGLKLALAIQVAKVSFDEFFGGPAKVLEARLAFEAAGGHQLWVPPSAVFSDAEVAWHEAMSAAFRAVCDQVPVKADDEQWDAVYIDVLPPAGEAFRTELAWRTAYFRTAKAAGEALTDDEVERHSRWAWRDRGLADPVFVATVDFKRQLSPGTPEFDAHWKGRIDLQWVWPTNLSVPARQRPAPAGQTALDGSGPEIWVRTMVAIAPELRTEFRMPRNPGVPGLRGRRVSVSLNTSCCARGS